MRDKRNPVTLQNCFVSRPERIFSMRDLALNGKTESAKDGGRYLLVNFDSDNLSCLFSIGKGKEEIKVIIEREVVDDYVNCLLEFKINRYFHFANVMCHCILTDVSDLHFDKLVQLVKKFKVNDPFLNLMIKHRQPDWGQSGGKFVQTKPYERLKEIIETDDESKGIRLLLDYLKKWYNTYRGTYWHDLHTDVEGAAYSGYWCWEAAAIVKIKGWDDTKLKDNEYYPYDAVHW